MSSGKCEVASHCLSLLSYLNFENKQNKQIFLHTQNLNYEKYGWISFLKFFKVLALNSHIWQASVDSHLACQ